MTILEDIQNAAVDAKSDLSTVLRKCKLLAVRLGSQALEDWVILESNGYADNIPVPNYRVWQLEIKGDFAGPFGSGILNAHIPYAMLPESVRDSYKQWECRQSVAGVEDVIRTSKQETLIIPTGDLALYIGNKLYKNQNCVHARAEFSKGNLVELLNSVRNRILDFTLAVWKEAPSAGEIGSGKQSTLEHNRITQIFNTTVYGGSANLVGSSNASLIAFNIGIKDFSAVERALTEQGVSQEDISELREVLDSEPELNVPNKFGPRVSKWVSKMTEKAAVGVWDIGLGAAGSIFSPGHNKILRAMS